MHPRLLSTVEITELERAYTVRGEPGLEPARRAWLDRWKARPDRETALALAFLDSYSCSEPEFLTGLPSLSEKDSRFAECARYLLAGHAGAESRFALGWMMTSFSWCCGAGPESEWAELGRSLWRVSLHDDPAPDPAAFAERGAYGKYFEHIATVQLLKRPDGNSGAPEHPTRL